MSIGASVNLSTPRLNVATASGSSSAAGLATIGNKARHPSKGPVKTAIEREEKRLAPQEEAAVSRLRNREQSIRAHEAAHQAAAGPYALGGARFVYQLGPDNKLYAVHGEVRIDSNPIPGDPQATLQKADVVKRAALAPGNPSAADKSAAARADRMAAAALQEISARAREELREKRGEIPVGTGDYVNAKAPHPGNGDSLLPSPEGPTSVLPGAGSFGAMDGGAMMGSGGATYEAGVAVESYTYFGGTGDFGASAEASLGYA